MTVKVDGLGALTQSLDALSADLNDMPLGGMTARMVSVAAMLAPRMSGKLAASIKPASTKNRASIVATAPHAGAINYGVPRRNIAPTRFMNQVDDRVNYVTFVDNEVEQLIRGHDL